MAGRQGLLRRPRGGGAPHLLQPPALLLLLLYALLALSQQLPLVLLVLPLLLLQLLPPQGLRALLVGQLEPQEVPPQSGLPWQVKDGAAGGRGRKVGILQGGEDPQCPGAGGDQPGKQVASRRGREPHTRLELSDPPLQYSAPEKPSQRNNRVVRRLLSSVTVGGHMLSPSPERCHLSPAPSTWLAHPWDM